MFFTSTPHFFSTDLIAAIATVLTSISDIIHFCCPHIVNGIIVMSNVSRGNVVIAINTRIIHFCCPHIFNGLIITLNISRGNVVIAINTRRSKTRIPIITITFNTAKEELSQSFGFDEIDYTVHKYGFFYHFCEHTNHIPISSL
jgi:hypothetical protein